MSTATASWLAEPWAAALLATVADPLASCDWSAEPAPLPGWPGRLPVEPVLRDPALRGRLGRWLLPEPATAPILAACQARPRTRLALLPAGEAAWLIARAAAWLDAPRLAGLLRRAEVAEARAALGAEAHDFALGGAALLPRPGAVLEAALAGCDTAPGAPALGAALFGLALGPAPTPLLDRLLLRRPSATWSEVVRLAGDEVAEPAREAAFHALRRLARERTAPWFAWLS